MEKKSHLLTHLKKQVIALKNQLEKLEKDKTHKYGRRTAAPQRHNRSASHSSRFDSKSLDCSDLDRGRRMYRQQRPTYQNLAELIKQKSKAERVPIYSSYRLAEYHKTRQNFSSQTPCDSGRYSRSPNPITGQGYNIKKKGVRICKLTRRSIPQRLSSRRHFDIYY